MGRNTYSAVIEIQVCYDLMRSNWKNKFENAQFIFYLSH